MKKFVLGFTLILNFSAYSDINCELVGAAGWIEPEIQLNCNVDGKNYNIIADGSLKCLCNSDSELTTLEECYDRPSQVEEQTPHRAIVLSGQEVEILKPNGKLVKATITD